MKRMCVLMCVVLAAGTVLAQESDVTYETTTTVTGGEDLISQGDDSDMFVARFADQP